MATTRAGSGQIQPNIRLEGNGGIVIPVGTTAQRNPNPVEGEIRFNTDLNTFEGYTGQVWGGMGPFPFVKSEYYEGDGSTYSFALEQQVANPDDLTVLLNGVQLRPGIDFQLVGQRNIVFEEDDGTIRPPFAGSTVSIRYFVPITSASVIANSISVEELAVVPGTTGQLLAIDQNQDLVFTSILPESSVGADQLIFEGSAGLDGQALLKDGNGFAFGEVVSISQNSVGIRELNVSDGQIGQVLATDGQGNLTFISVSADGGGGSVSNFFDLSGQIGYSQIPDNIIDIAKLDVTDGTNGQLLATNGSGDLFFTDPQAGSGGITNGLNLGTGIGIFDSVSSDTLQFNSISAASGISITKNLNNIEITNTAPNISQNTFNSIIVAGNDSITASSSTDSLILAAGNNIGIDTNAQSNTITISNTQNVFSQINSDIGSTTANTTTDALTISGGTSISTSITGDILTIEYTGAVGGGDPNQNAFSNIAVSGQTTISADQTTDTLNIVAGTGISVTTNDATDTITITNTYTPALSINDLTDVDTATSSPTSGQVLKWDGSKWAPANDVTTGGSGLDADTLDGFEGTYYLDYANFTNAPTINSGTSGRLAYYSATDTELSETSNDLTWDNTNGNLTVGGTLAADAIQSTGTGVPTFTSGSDIQFDAASGAGQVDITGSVVVSGTTTAPVITTNTIQTSGSTIGISATNVNITSTNPFVDPGDIKQAGATSNQILVWNASNEAWEPSNAPLQNTFVTFTGNEGTTTADDASDVLNIVGGNGIYTDVLGDTLTVSTLHTFDIVSNGASDYTFSDSGNNWFPTSENDPVLYLRRGETYIFDVNASGHPFEIRLSNGGAAYNTGITNNAVQIGQLTFTVPMSAPSTLYYQCTVHGIMGNTINIV